VPPPAAGRTLRRLAALLAAATAGLAAAVLPAAPATAHSPDGPRATDYRSRIVSVRPQVDGLRVALLANGTRLEVENRGAREVVVLGYAGEPYRRLGPDGAYVNLASPSLAVDEGRPVPASDAAPSAPRWRKEHDEPVARWHDHRVHWTGSARPPAVAADPERPARLRAWQVDLERGPERVTVRGTLDYLPPPAAPQVWWAGMLVAAAAVALLARHRRGVAVLSVALAVAAVPEVLDALGRAADRSSRPLGLVGELLTGQAYGLLTALGALGAVAAAAARRPAAVLALGLAGACLAAVGGLVDAAVFSHGQVPVPWHPSWSRLGTALTTALGAGVAAGAALRTRAASAGPGDPPARAEPVRPGGARPGGRSRTAAPAGAPPAGPRRRAGRA